MRRLSAAFLIAFLVGLGFGALPVAAGGSSAKVVIVVGPVGDHNRHYKADARAIAAEARRHTPNVVTLFTPDATWAAVKVAAQGANVFVYLGHGNGWPSVYPPFQTITKDGLGLDPSSGADGSKHVYYGEDYIRNNIRFAPNAVVLLYHLCYASGNTEPGLPQGTFAEARERVDNYGAGFIGAGARAVIAEGHPAHPASYEIRQLFTTKRTLAQIFRNAPTWHGHLQGPFASQRTPGLAFAMDADAGAPAGFYRSIVGDLGLRASTVTGRQPVATGNGPADFVVPGAAEVTDPDGVGLFGSLAKAQDPSASAASSIPRSTRLRLTKEPDPATDGTRVFAVTILGTSTRGYVRATGITPRDSAATSTWSLDRSASLLSPNDDGLHDALVVAARFSERVSATLRVRNAAGKTVRSQTLEGDIVRFAWPLTGASGDVVKDGPYTWSLKANDDWGNAGVSAHGGFTLDATAPTAKATQRSTAGLDGWKVSPVAITMTAADALSGVRGITYRVNGGATKAYRGPVTIAANGRATVDYRAIDKAGNRGPWRHLAYRIDSRVPAIAVAMNGTAGDAPSSWRSDVTLKPAFSDATSGVAGKLVAIDGKPAKALTQSSVVIEKDGSHVVAFTATDAAGNQATTSRTFRIDTVSPVVRPAAGDKPPTVSPNGDGIGETVTIPFTVSEPSVVSATVAGPDGAAVRTLTSSVTSGGSFRWDGRTARGKALPDGRYTVTIAARDSVGNTGRAAPVDVDVYASLAGLERSTPLFYPQDADRLAPRAAVAYRLLSPARVTIQVVDAQGAVVRRAVTDKAQKAGPASWSWNGKVAGGHYAKPGTYRIVVSATNGTQRATQSVSVTADAFRLAASVPAAVRGKAFTDHRAICRGAVHDPGRDRPGGRRRPVDGHDDEGLRRDLDGDDHAPAPRLGGHAGARREGP